jgi:phosphoglycolate phosphatase-like HAD superfamily hydrolase
MGEANARPGETVMVGDSATDVRTARAAGVMSVAVDYGYDPEGLTTHAPDVLLDDLRKLPSVL